MSLAMNIVDLVSAKAKAADACKVNQVDLELGALSGVLADALLFCFEAAAKNTMVEGAVLNIVEREGRGKCLSCGASFSMDSLVANCPECGQYATEVVQGQELRVISFVVDE